MNNYKIPNYTGGRVSTFDIFEFISLLLYCKYRFRKIETIRMSLFRWTISLTKRRIRNYFSKNNVE